MPARSSNADIDRAMSRRLFERREILQSESSLLLSELESVDAAKTDLYRERMEKAVREYNELGISDLTRYVCHRRVIIDLLAKALSLQPGDGKYGREWRRLLTLRSPLSPSDCYEATTASTSTPGPAAILTAPAEPGGWCRISRRTSPSGRLARFRARGKTASGQA